MLAKHINSDHEDAVQNKNISHIILIVSQFLVLTSHNYYWFVLSPIYCQYSAVSGQIALFHCSVTFFMIHLNGDLAFHLMNN